MDSMIYPSHLVPEKPWVYGDFRIEAHQTVFVRNDRGHHIGKSIKVSGFKDITELTNWLYFHALVADSFELVDYNENADIYKLDLAPDGLPITEPSNFDDIGLEVYRMKFDQKISYSDLYKKFLTKNKKLVDMIQTFFLTESLKSHSARIRTIPIAYWQINMYVSILEVLLGPPPNCENEISCSICGANLGEHHLLGTNEWIKKQLLDNISDEETMREYKKIINISRNAIRHKTIHEGLVPSSTSPQLEDGSYYYGVNKIIKEYKQDRFAEDSLISGLRQIVRARLLYEISGEHIYPFIRGGQISSVTINRQK